MHRAGLENQFTFIFFYAGSLGQGGGVLAHADDMKAGFGIAELRRQSQPVDDLQTRLVKFPRPFPNFQFECLVLLGKHIMEDSHGEQIVDAVEELHLVEGLGDEFGSAHFQSANAGVMIIAGGQHHDRHGVPVTDLGPVLQNVEAVEVGHIDVEQEQVESLRRQQAADLTGVGDAVNVAIGFFFEDFLQKFDVGRVVIYDQDVRGQNRFFQGRILYLVH